MSDEYFNDHLVLAAGVGIPSDDYINQQMKLDKLKNPYNDPNKPKLRSAIEIIADYRVEVAFETYKSFIIRMKTRP